MAKTNFQYEKRQRELEKKRKAEEKARRKQDAKRETPEGAADDQPQDARDEAALAGPARYSSRAGSVLAMRVELLAHDVNIARRARPIQPDATGGRSAGLECAKRTTECRRALPLRVRKRRAGRAGKNGGIVMELMTVSV